MSLVRIYKSSSNPVGNLKPVAGQNIIEFQDSIKGNELILNKLGYLLLDMTLTQGDNPGGDQANKVPMYAFGAMVDDVQGRYSQYWTPYKPGCLIGNSRLESEKMNVLESNHKVNLLMNNLLNVQETNDVMDGHSYSDGSVSYDISQGAGAIVPAFMNLLKEGADPSSLKSNKVLVPLSQVLPSFGAQEMAPWLGSQYKHTYELDTRKLVIGEMDPLYFQNNDQGQSKASILNFDGTTPTAQTLNQIVLAGTYESINELYSKTKILPNSYVGLYARLPRGANNANVNVGISARIQSAANNGVVWNPATKKITITFTANVWVANEAFQAGQPRQLLLNIVRFDDYAAGQAETDSAITTVEYTSDNQSPLYVGMACNLYWHGDLDGGGDITWNRMQTIITNIARNNGENTITFANSGADELFRGVTDNIFIECCSNARDTSPATYTINQAQLVSWHRNLGKGALPPKNKMMVVDKYELTPKDNAGNTTFQTKFELPQNTIQAFILSEVDSRRNLLSQWDGIDNYRLSFDNQITTYSFVQKNSSLYYDRLMRAVGSKLANLTNDEEMIIGELNNSGNPSPMFGVYLNSASGQTLTPSIVNIFAKTTDVLKQ